MLKDPTLSLVIILTAVALVVGLVLPDWARFLVTVALGKGLVVLGLLVLWRAGLVSFGQALFFASGAYAVGLVSRYLDMTDMFALLVLGGAAGALMAFICGFLLARYREIFFAMLSLALSMILYGVLVKSETLGSTDGIGLPTATVIGFELGTGFELALYAIAVVLSAACATAVQVYLKSLRGRLAEALRDNEVRVEYLGMSARSIVHVKLTISGALAGFGGALIALAVGHIDPEMAYWTTSGGFVFITILSGPGSVVAPFLGGLIFETIRSFSMSYVPEFWQIILGGALLLAIFFLPNGIWSLFTRKTVKEAQHATHS